MRWRYIAKSVGVLNLFFGLTMVFAVICGFYYQDSSVLPLLKSIGLTVCIAAVLCFVFKGTTADILTQREGIAIVALSWMTIGIVGALPFYLGIDSCSFVDAVFESVSGFTTTGASILTDIESVPKGLLFWRSFIQWLGGMGIIVLSVAILPFLGVGGMQLYKAEVPSPVPDKLKPRIRDTAMTLWKVYLLLTLAEVVLLMLGGMTFTMPSATPSPPCPPADFQPKTHPSPILTVSISIRSSFVFMVLAGINFSLHYQLLEGNIPGLLAGFRMPVLSRNGPGC